MLIIERELAEIEIFNSDLCQFEVKTDIKGSITDVELSLAISSDQDEVVFDQVIWQKNCSSAGISGVCV